MSPFQARCRVNASTEQGGYSREAATTKSDGRAIATADAIIATQAITNDAELVHKDPEFEAVVGLRQQQLPYKTKSRRRSYHKLEKSGSRFIPD